MSTHLLWGQHWHRCTGSCPCWWHQWLGTPPSSCPQPLVQAAAPTSSVTAMFWHDHDDDGGFKVICSPCCTRSVSLGRWVCRKLQRSPPSLCFSSVPLSCRSWAPGLSGWLQAQHRHWLQGESRLETSFLKVDLRLSLKSSTRIISLMRCSGLLFRTLTMVRRSVERASLWKVMITEVGGNCSSSQVFA